MSPVPTCNQVRTNGALCGSPRLKDGLYCYFHQRDHQRLHNLSQARTVKLSTKAPDRDDMDAEILESLALPVLEDANAIQVAMTTVLRAFAGNHIRPRRAGILVYGLAVAASNLPRLRLNLYQDDQVAARDPEPIKPLVRFEPVPQQSLVSAAFYGTDTPPSANGETTLDDAALAAEYSNLGSRNSVLATRNSPSEGNGYNRTGDGDRDEVASATTTRNSVLGTRNSPHASSATSAGAPAGTGAAAPAPFSSESSTPPRIRKAPTAARAPRRSSRTR